MSTITLRSVKGSPLTNTEVDDNFSNLNTDKYQSGASPDFVDTLTDKLSLDTGAAATAGVGEFAWDDGNGTAVLGLKGGNTSLQVGQEIVARVYNDSGVALTDGQIVYISGAQGNRIAVKLAKADAEATSAGTLGMVTESIAIGAEGFITMVGTVNHLDTSSLTAGALVYLSASTAGAYTTTPPTAPNHRVTLGYVERVHATVGSIYVKVDNGYEIDELHNVLISGVASGNTLIYDASANVWKNANLTDGTGISITEGPGSITVTNTAPDQTVVLTSGTGISASGTYPNFTIAIDSTVATLSGTQTLTNKRVTNRVTSITGAAGGTITPASDTSDQYNITALGASATLAVPSGTPTDSQKLTIRFYSAAAQTLSWTTTAGGYRAIGTTLPTTTGVGKTIYVGCIYNAADAYWDVVSVATQA